jgi:hypothetical protein
MNRFSQFWARLVAAFETMQKVNFDAPWAIRARAR